MCVKHYIWMISVKCHTKYKIHKINIWMKKNRWSYKYLCKFDWYFIQDRYVATKGGPKQVLIIRNMLNRSNGLIFSIPGDIAINCKYQNNGHRLALTGGHLSDIYSNDENTHGLGNHVCIGRTNITSTDAYRIDISNIQDFPLRKCSIKNVIIQGTDHGSDYYDGPDTWCFRRCINISDLQ